jgi:aminopeptidase N
LIGTFCGANIRCFHEKSGAGYEFLADQVLALDSINPQIASRMLTPLSRWQRFDLQRQKLMKKELKRILTTKPSKNVYEIAAKSLGVE